MDYSNGQLSPNSQSIPQNPSFLPDPSAPSPTSPTRAEAVPSGQSPDEQDEDIVMKDEESDLSDGLSDADASGDDDFEIDFPAQTPASANGRSSSPDASRPLKRKAGGMDNEEEAMRANPELYGLRRSVRDCCRQFVCWC